MAEILEEYMLPSNGRLGEDYPTKITMRNMKTSEEKLLLGSYDDAITEILKKCTVSPEKVDFSKMISADRHFLIIKLRALSYGNDYAVNYRCPVCTRISEFNIDINGLDVRYLPDDFKEPYAEFELPQSKDLITLVIPRMKDIADIEDKTKKWQKRFPEAKGDISYIYSLMAVISTVNGDTMRFMEKQRYVEELSARDASYIRNKVSKLEVGIDPTVTVTCPRIGCGAEFEFVLPMGAEFFYTKFDD